MTTSSDTVTPSDTFTDLELQWFRGGVRVTDVIHLVTEDDIVVSVPTK